MNKCRLLLVFGIMAGGVLLFGVSKSRAQEDMHNMQHQQMSQQFKVGKAGNMKLDQETKIGDLVLRPGEYRFVHRVEGENHFVQFNQGDHQVGEVRCQLEPLGKKASETAITTTNQGGVRRITRIKVAGENVAHLF